MIFPFCFLLFQIFSPNFISDNEYWKKIIFCYCYCFYFVLFFNQTTTSEKKQPKKNKIKYSNIIFKKNEQLFSHLVSTHYIFFKTRVLTVVSFWNVYPLWELCQDKSWVRISIIELIYYKGSLSILIVWKVLKISSYLYFSAFYMHKCFCIVRCGDLLSMTDTRSET